MWLLINIYTTFNAIFCHASSKQISFSCTKPLGMNLQWPIEISQPNMSSSK